MGGTSRVEMDQVSASQVLLADLRKLSGFVVAKWVLFSDDKKSTRISNRYQICAFDLIDMAQKLF